MWNWTSWSLWRYICPGRRKERSLFNNLLPWFKNLNIWFVGLYLYCYPGPANVRCRPDHRNKDYKNRWPYFVTIGCTFYKITAMEWVGLHVFSPHRRNVQWCNFILISFCPNFVHVNPFRISSSSNLLSVLIILTENSLTLPSSPAKIHSMNRLISALTISFPRSGAGVANGNGGTELGND